MKLPKLPNVISIALITALIAFLQYIASGAGELFPAVWVPVAVLVIGAAVKALQVYLETRGAGGATRAAERNAINPVQRWLMD